MGQLAPLNGIRVLRRRTTLKVGVGLAMLGALGTVGVGLASSAQRKAQPNVMLVHHKAGIARSLEAHFALFRRAAMPLPPSAAAALSRGNVRLAYGLNLSEAARVVSHGLTIWEVPGSWGVCQYILGFAIRTVRTSFAHPDAHGPAGITECAPVAGTNAGTNMLMNISDSGKAVLVGLAPDGNSAVRVTETNGASVTVPVRENVYVFVGVQRQSWRNMPTVALRNAAGNLDTHSAP